MPVFRCLNCKNEIEALSPSCAACELDPAKNPGDADYFAKVETMHFDPPTKVAGRGKNFAACNPKLKVGAAGHRFTGDPEVVNCAACKASEAFLAANGETNGVAAIKLQPVPKK